MSNFGRSPVFYITLSLSAVLLLLLMIYRESGTGPHRAPKTEIAYSDFLNEVGVGQVQSVEIQGRTIQAELTDGRTIKTFIPEDPTLIHQLTDKGLRVVAKPEADENTLLHYLLSWFPMLLLVVTLVFFMRQMRSDGGRSAGFGKSRARMLTEKQGRVTFEDVAGVDDAKGELQEIVEFLRDPQRFQRLGGKIPKGVLLVGPPGTGKTLLARAIASEANVPFFTISGSDFVEMFVGVGASRVRDMFEQGKKNAPCIIFIDEIDAVGRHRGAGPGGGNDEREQTLNQMLVEMDGFESNEGVILIAATNRFDLLDPALLRPGRFDRQVVVSRPDVHGREKILQLHMQKMPLSSDVDPKTLAQNTLKFVGADLVSLVNEAALLAARNGQRKVEMDNFRTAFINYVRRSGSKENEYYLKNLSTDATRRACRYTAGQILVARHLGLLSEEVIYISGSSLCSWLPEPMPIAATKTEVQNIITAALGGRAAEEIIQEDGANSTVIGESDIRFATDLAEKCVRSWGFGSSGSYRVVQKGGDAYAPELLRRVDREIDDLVRDCLDCAKEILKGDQKGLEILLNALAENGIVFGNMVTTLLTEGLNNYRMKVMQTPQTDELLALPDHLP